MEDIVDRRPTTPMEECATILTPSSSMQEASWHEYICYESLGGSGQHLLLSPSDSECSIDKQANLNNEPLSLQKFNRHRLFYGHRDVGSNQRFDFLATTGKQLIAMGQPSLALAYYNQALRLKSKTLETEDEHIKVRFADILMDVALMQAMDPTKGITALLLCLDIRQKCLEPDHPSIATAFFHLAEAYLATNQLSLAQDCLQEALGIQLANKADDFGVFHTWTALGRVQHSLGFIEDAMDSFEEACRFLWQHRQERPHEVARGLAYLCRCRGNLLDCSQELNEAVSFVDAMAKEETQDRESPTARAA